MRHLFAFVAALLLAAVTGAVLAADAAAAKRYQVVIQVSDADPRGWAQALNYTENLQETLGRNNVEVELVALGQGLGILKLDSPHATRVADAMKRDIKIVACEISMKRQKLTRDDMLSNLGYAPAGLVQIINRQRQGWNYIKG